MGIFPGKVRRRNVLQRRPHLAQRTVSSAMAVVNAMRSNNMLAWRPTQRRSSASVLNGRSANSEVANSRPIFVGQVRTNASHLPTTSPATVIDFDRRYCRCCTISLCLSVCLQNALFRPIEVVGENGLSPGRSNFVKS